MVLYFPVAPSSAPGNVQASSISSTSAKVSWQAPSAIDHNGILVSYTIYVQAVGGGFTDGTIKQKQVPASLTVANVTGLEAYVEYSIKVSASTGVGEGPFSASVIVRTKEAGKSFFFLLT